jgi:hypothetical protein
VPKKSKPAKHRAFYKSPPPTEKSNLDFVQTTPIPAAPFELREDGSIAPSASDPLPAGAGTVNPARHKSKPVLIRQVTAKVSPSPGGEGRGEGGHGGRPQGLPELIFSSDTPFVRLYHGNCLELLDAIAAKYPDGRFDAIFADPPYFLSNGGISCHAGRMVEVNKLSARRNNFTVRNFLIVANGGNGGNHSNPARCARACSISRCKSSMDKTMPGRRCAMLWQLAQSGHRSATGPTMRSPPPASGFRW